MAFSIATVLQHQQGSRCLGSVGLCVLCVLTMAYCVSISHSIVLMLALWISVFALCSLLSALYSMTITHMPTERYSYGLARVPVLAVFSTTVLAQLFSIFLSKESFEHLLSPDHHGSHDGGAHEHETDHIGSFPYYLGAVASSISLLLSAYALKNQPFQYVLTSATSSSLQEHAADLSQAICYVVPGLSRLLLPRINAMVLLAITSSGLLLLCDHFRTDFAWADPVCCLVLCVAVFSTMWPLSSYTGMILLQTAPPHLLNQIDRCISEASTIDGVLEIKTGHFWQLDFSQLVGSVDVRVRRDADEQKVLVMVTEKLSSVLNTLTVQIVKDAGWQSSPNMGSMAVEQDHGHHGHSHNDGHGHSHDHSDHGHSHDGGDDHHGHSHSEAPSAYGSGYSNQGYANQGYGISQQQQQQQQDYNAYWQQQQQAAAWQQYQQQQQQAQQNHGHSHGADGEHHGHSHDGVTYH